MSPKSWRAVLPRRGPGPDAPAPEVLPHRHPKLAHRIAILERSGVRVRRRVAALEEGLQEQRRLSLRVAELTDIVTELVAAAARGEDEFRRVLGKLDSSVTREADAPPAVPHDD